MQYRIIYGSALKSAWSHTDLRVSDLLEVEFVLTSWELILLV